VPINQLPKSYLGRAANMRLTDEEDDEVMRSMGRPPRRQAERLRKEQRERECRQQEQERRQQEEEWQQRRRDFEQFLRDMERNQQIFDGLLARLRERRGKTAAPTMTRQELENGIAPNR
jgi:hypothetical protein